MVAPPDWRRRNSRGGRDRPRKLGGAVCPKKPRWVARNGSPGQRHLVVKARDAVTMGLRTQLVNRSPQPACLLGLTVRRKFAAHLSDDLGGASMGTTNPSDLTPSRRRFLTRLSLALS